MRPNEKHSKHCSFDNSSLGAVSSNRMQVRTGCDPRPTVEGYLKTACISNLVESLLILTASVEALEAIAAYSACETAVKLCVAPITSLFSC